MVINHRRKKLVIAHFLRFIDPLNYFVAPGKNHQISVDTKNVGESIFLTQYIRHRFKDEYGENKMHEFMCKAKVPDFDDEEYNNKIIRIQYGMNIKKRSREEDKEDYNCKIRESRKSSKSYCVSTGDRVHGMSKLALTIVRDYLEKNPNITYEQLRRIFDMKLSSNHKDLIRLKSHLKPEEFTQNRKRLDFNNPLELYSKDTIYLNNQWQSQDLDEFAKIIEPLGYSFETI